MIGPTRRSIQFAGHCLIVGRASFAAKFRSGSCGFIVHVPSFTTPPLSGFNFRINIKRKLASQNLIGRRAPAIVSVFG